MAHPRATYVFTTCHVGLEGWLKADILRHQPAWRVAFARPGFLTWRVGTPLSLPWHTPVSPFAHAFGVCWGQARTPEELVHWAAQLSAQKRRLRLHAWARPHAGVAPDALDAVVATLRTELPHAFLEDGPAQVGDGVLDVIAVDRDVWWAGWHVHTQAHGPWPGGHWPIVVPDAAPSRAYAKLATTLRWAGLPLRPGETAVELGAAPGGAAYALLERDVDVWGVDPGIMDPAVAALAEARGRTFVHLQKAAGEVRRHELPRAAHWLVSDMNLAAPVAWRYVKRFLPWWDTLRGLVLTLKLNDDAALANLPELIGAIREAGSLRVRVAQLPAYRREVVVVALTAQ